ncbi:hypothetical protein SS50377_21494 [Spironucleus salmonicida]|uniref:Uncharacterized protein n=1 Tax=Spironucleus salmonicida TaxID=348837 RepID=A0A9P8S0E4_9EUKA|nr:hypothetical protein SS50377_21494 [Spironucleus salmonicida]
MRKICRSLKPSTVKKCPPSRVTLSHSYCTRDEASESCQLNFMMLREELDNFILNELDDQVQ